MQTLHASADDLRPNGWNPNQMSPRQFEAEIESILRFGFIDPITVREKDGLEIVDGEHRWKAWREIRQRWHDGTVIVVADADYDSERGWIHADGRVLDVSEANPTLEETLQTNQLPIFNLGVISDAHAKKLTVVLNETRGRSSSIDLATLLADIGATVGTDDLRVGLPYGDEELHDILKLAEYDWNALEQSDASTQTDSEAELFVKIELSMSQSAHLVWLQAGDKVRGVLAQDNRTLHNDVKLANGQIAEALAAEYLASP